MRSRLIEVDDVFLEHVAEVLFPEDQDVIEAFASDAPDQPLADRVGPRRLHGGSQYLNPAARGNGGEVWTVLGIVVTNEILRRRTERRGLAQVLGNPGIGW